MSGRWATAESALLHHGAVTTEMAPQAILEAIAAFFGDHEVASLKLPSGWFGRPYDNWHQLTEVATDGELVLIRLDERQTLKLDASDAAIDGRTLRIVIRAGVWDWVEYGGTTRHQEVLDQGAVEFYAPFH